MAGKHAWVDHGETPLRFAMREWLAYLWDPVLYIVAALLCAILAIDAFVLMHGL
jgi:hypothetical protein